VLENEASWRQSLAEGLRYVYSRRVMFLLLALVALASIFGIPYIVFVPLFAAEVLHVAERGLGMLLAFSGLGAFLGAITIAYLGKVRCRGSFVIRASVGFYLGIMVFSLSRWFALSALMLAATGYCMILMVATVNTLLQHLSTDAMRGRVMSLYATAFLGFAPIGSLLAGSLAGVVGAPRAIALMSGVALVASLALYFRSTELKQLD
jgi:predicted MFS family arabinose efflux permease